MTELILEVDVYDNPIWKDGRKQYHNIEQFFNGAKIHRSAHNILVDENTNDLIMQLRPEDHFCVPNKLDFPCGGYVNGNEPYIAAALREMREETKTISEVTELFGFYYEFEGVDKSHFKIFGGRTNYEKLEPGDDCKELLHIPLKELTNLIGKCELSPVFETALALYLKNEVLI